jgi:hypothetical protein
MLLSHLGQSPRVESSAYVAPTATVCGDVSIGAHSRIMHGASIVAEGGRIEIGDYCIIMENAVVRSTGRHSARVGRHCCRADRWLAFARRPRSPGASRHHLKRRREGDAMDTDLEAMSRAQLIAEVRKLPSGIRKHRDSTGHELWWQHPALWALLPERSDPVNEIPLMIGGRGRDGVGDFYANHFGSQFPPDMEIAPVSRTIVDRTLPVRGGEIAARVLNPTQPMNELIRPALNKTR